MSTSTIGMSNLLMVLIGVQIGILFRVPKGDTTTFTEFDDEILSQK